MRRLSLAAILAALILALAACGGDDDEDTASPPPATTTEETTTEDTTTTDDEDGTTDDDEDGTTDDDGDDDSGNEAAGADVFASAGCGSCHALEAAGSSGNVGPNLDESEPDFDLVVDRVTNGQGAMPSFSGQLSEQQIRDVAAYVSENAGED